MPIYEYQCLDCGVHFDKLQRFGELGPDACPEGHKHIQRLLSQPAIIFKGSGFYVTDHGRNGSRSRSGLHGRPKTEPKVEGGETAD